MQSDLLIVLISTVLFSQCENILIREAKMSNQNKQASQAAQIDLADDSCDFSAYKPSHYW